MTRPDRCNKAAVGDIPTGVRRRGAYSPATRRNCRGNPEGPVPNFREDETIDAWVSRLWELAGIQTAEKRTHFRQGFSKFSRDSTERWCKTPIIIDYHIKHAHKGARSDVHTKRSLHNTFFNNWRQWVSDLGREVEEARHSTIQ